MTNVGKPFEAYAVSTWYGFKKGDQLRRLQCELENKRDTFQSIAELFSFEGHEEDEQAVKVISDKIQALFFCVKTLKEVTKGYETSAKRKRFGTSMLTKIAKGTHDHIRPFIPTSMMSKLEGMRDR